jgi:hypothetical protein
MTCRATGWPPTSTATKGSDWDAFLLFGPDATWTSQPTALRSSGGSVAGQIDQLSQSLSPLLDIP